jgi:DNA-binding response OmpR family regulator
MSRLLVIDDDAGVAFALERSLTASGFDVRVSSDAEEGLALAARERFDLVLLDLRLPGLGGEAALAALRSRDAGLPVIVMTAHGTAETRRALLAAGASDFLPKPFELSTIKRAIGQLLGAPA